MGLFLFFSNELLQWILLLLFTVVIASLLIPQFLRSRKLPPGPWSIPFIGYFPLFTHARPEKYLTELSQNYGSIFSVRCGDQLVVVLGNYEVIKEALVKQTVFHGRPTGNVFRVKGDEEGILSSEGEMSKENRNFATKVLRQFGLGKLYLEEKIHDEINSFLDELEKCQGEPMDPTVLVNMSISNVICLLIFAKRFSYDDEFFALVRENLNNIGPLFSPVAPRGFYSWANRIPFLRKLLGQEVLLKMRRDFEKLATSMIDEHEKTLSKTHPKDYLDACLLERHKNIESQGSEGAFNYSRIEDNLFGLHAAGSDTPACSLRWALIYLLHYPEVQEKLQKEIDEVIGQERPSVRDRKKMPYMEAVILEVLRISSPIPLNLIHSNTEETVLGGYLIPKRSHIITNLWAVHHDPTLWDDPHDFKPERFLNQDGQVEKPEYLIPFSIGRRACIGESLASMELFLYLTSILQRFTLMAPDGEMASLESIFGIVLEAKHFQMKAIARCE